MSGEKIVINGAASQYDRWLRALAPDYAEVDGRSFTDLLAFGVRFGALVNFYNTEDRIDGDWVEFFLCNPSMLLASILAIDRGDIGREFRRLRAEAGERRRFERKVERLAEAFALIHRAAFQTNLWLRAAQADKKAPWAQEIRARILAALERGLADHLRQIEATAAAARTEEGIGHAIDLVFDEFDPAWGVGEGETEESFFDGETPEARAVSAWLRLEPAIRDLLYLTGDLQRIARSWFAESLKANDHQPQIALYMAFCRLFKRAQDTLNTFSRRYIDFYYRDVLRDRRAPAIGDRVYLTFTLAASEDVFSSPVPAGTLFPAGEAPDGLEIMFAADRALSVTATAIERLLTLRIEDAPLWFDATRTEPPHGNDRHHHHHHHHPHPPPPDPRSTVSVPALAVASDIVLPGDGVSDFATFGQPVPEETEREAGRLASLGFALTTQTLLLSGGTRTVTLRFGVQDGAAKPTLSERLQLIADETGLDPATVFETVLNGAFVLSVYTEDGWVAVDYAAAARTEPTTSFALSFIVSPEFPPLRLPEEPDETAEGFVPAAPAVRAELRQQAVTVSGREIGVSVLPFALIDAVDVTAIAVDVSADPLPVTVLRNTDGEIDPASPYPFFGGSPEVGCYFEIQQTELFVKSVYEVTIRVDWFELPQDAQGFEGYYQFYTVGADGKPLIPPITNVSFKADLSVKNPGWWRFEAAGDRSRIESFVYRTRTDDGGDAIVCGDGDPEAAALLCPYTRFGDLDIARTGAGPHYDPEKSAIRIQLKAPAYGYGSSLYAPNVLNAVIADLPDSGLCEAKCQAACEIWNNLQTRIQTALDECAGLAGEDYFICITAKLAAVIVRLVAAYEACKRNCPPGEPSAAEDNAVGALRDLVAGLPGMLEPQQRGALAGLRKGLDLNSSPCRQACRNFIRVGLDIAAALVEAAILAPEIPPETEVPKSLQPVLDAMAQYYAQCLDTCIALCMQPKNTLKYPNEPYLPQAENVAVSYRADVSLPALRERPSDLAFYHLTPFGGYEQRAVGEAGAPLLPRYAEPGNLYLGLSPFLRAQELTLLFQMANPRAGGMAETLPPVAWACLSDNTWSVLPPGQVLSDGTGGLQSTGIAALRLPAVAGTGTVMPPAQRWLRASVARDANLFPRTVAVTPQALLARRVQDAGQTAMYDGPVPAGTIASAVQDLGDVSGIAQPMPSFGGRPPQDERDFTIASGERLRHKERAALGWDYERLVLERFPDIWKVKALAAHDAATARVPGSVLVVVVPGPDFPQVADPTVPAAPGEVLGEIAAYLRERASPFASIRVDNPLYVRLKVEAQVVFAGGSSSGDALTRLNDELVQYLSPWFYDAERANSRYWEESEVAAFIQSRPYVSALLALTLTRDPAEEAQPADWCFVTSAREHAITDAGFRGRQ